MSGCSQLEIHSIFPLAATFNNFIASFQKLLLCEKYSKGLEKKPNKPVLYAPTNAQALKYQTLPCFEKLNNCLNFFVISWVFF